MTTTIEHIHTDEKESVREWNHMTQMGFTVSSGFFDPERNAYVFDEYNEDGFVTYAETIAAIKSREKMA